MEDSQLETAARKALLINGPPASGKSFIGASLRDVFGFPLISLDTIKVALFDTLGTGDRDYNRMLGRASQAVIWSMLADFPLDAAVIIDAWFGFPPYDRVTQGLQNAGVIKFPEIWCYAPGEVLAKRYNDRVGLRHHGHPGREYSPELVDVAKRAHPMGLSPVLKINTEDPTQINLRDVATWVAAELNLS